MKKFIAFLISFSMVGCCVSYASETSGIINVTMSYFEDFSTCALGGAPSTGTATPKGNMISVQAEENTSNKWLKYEVLGTDDMYFQYDVSSIEENCIIEFDINMATSGNGEFLICFKDASNKEIQIMHIDSARNLCSADGAVIARLADDKTYRICAVLSLASGSADIYIDHRKKTDGISVSGDFDGVNTIRFHLYKISATNSIKPIVYLDNFCTYDLPNPLFKYEQEGITVKAETDSVAVSGIADENTMLQYMENTVALYVNQNTYAVDGEVMLLDADNPDVCVYVENGRAFVPIRFVAQAIDGGKKVSFDNETRSAFITDNEHKLIFTEGNNQYTIDGKDMQLDAPPRIFSGRMFVPIRAVSEGFGKKVTYDKSGMIIIADRENFFNFSNDLHIFRKLAYDMVFKTPDADWMINMLKEHYPGYGHPRIFVNSSKLADIKNGIASNEMMAKWYGEVINEADNMLDSELLKYEISDGVRLLSVSRAARERIQTLSFVYLMTGDSKYAKKAYDELANVCSFKDWNPSHFLDTAEMTEAVAVGYDWLYNYMNAEQRQKIREAICLLGLNPALEDYTDVPGRNRTYKWAQSAVADNWNLVCNSGILIGALAVADEDSSIAAQILTAGMELIKKAIILYGPDGAWYEGPNYWEYATSYYVDLMAALDSIYSDTFGYMETPGVALTGYYINALTSSGGMFNYHDGSSATINSPTIFFLADKANDPALSELRIDQMKKRSSVGKFRDIMWYNYRMQDSDAQLELDYYYRDTEVAVMRSNWIDESSIYLGIHAGNVNVYHGHMDIGQFIIDAYDTRYAVDLGAENYNIPDNKWNLYRYRAEGHNTLVINPGKSGGQLVSGKSVVDRFESDRGCSLAVIDMTSAYSDSATSVKRGYKLTNNRTMIIIQDEIHTKAPSEVYWFMHTNRDIQLSEDGKSAIVKGKYRDMYVYVLSDVQGSFSVMDAIPLDTSPTNSLQNANLGYRKLTFNASDVTDATIAIGFSFDAPGLDAQDMYHPQVIPLDEWTLDESASYEMPELSDLTVNGNSIDGFSPDVLSYTYRVKDGESTPLLAAKSDNATVSIAMPDELPASAVITVVSDEDSRLKTNYIVKFDKEILRSGPAGTEAFGISSVEASSVPQPENPPMATIDGNLTTRWSAQGKADIVYDLGKSVKISHIGVAVYQDSTGDGRQQYFDVYVSDDGEDYELCYSGESTGTTLEMEVFPITPVNGRYVKLTCKGTSVGKWNSITEFAAYGPVSE